jgi:fatty-acyl-CoA synthase
VNTSGSTFEGYYNNPEATTDRLRNGWYFTGDLAYRDADGFFYFAGRSADWLRVDSENFAAAPVEAIVSRFPGVVMAAVYPVPDPVTGDMVMLALEMSESAGGASVFDPAAFDRFLDEQRDLGTKWSPRLVRIVRSMPLTANNKVHKPPLRADKWRTDDLVYWRPRRSDALTVMGSDDRAALEGEFAANSRAHLITAL